MKQHAIVKADTARIAELMSVTREHATDNIVKEPDFPEPVVDVSQRIRFWDERAVLEWMAKRTKKRRGGRRRSVS